MTRKFTMLRLIAKKMGEKGKIPKVFLLFFLLLLLSSAKESIARNQNRKIPKTKNIRIVQWAHDLEGEKISGGDLLEAQDTKLLRNVV